jgi:hypothetical protein
MRGIDLLGLAVRTTDDESFCYRSTTELLRLARRSKDFKGALRIWRVDQEWYCAKG